MEIEKIQELINSKVPYLPVSKIEESLGMPPTTLQKFLSGKRVLPKKWEKVLLDYFHLQTFPSSYPPEIDTESLDTFKKLYTGKEEEDVKTRAFFLKDEKIILKEPFRGIIPAIREQEFKATQMVTQMLKYCGYCKKDVLPTQVMNSILCPNCSTILSHIEDKTELDPEPVRLPGENSIDFAARKNEWKSKTK
jgi:hypothetical protein